MKKVVRAALSAILYLCVAVLLVLEVPALAGIHTYVITSGSMEPKIKVGSVVYVHKGAFEDISENDVITFMAAKDTYVTHRVVSVDTDGQRFTTKGDANDTEDAKKVSFANVCGEVLCTVPYLGYAAAFLSTRYGKAAAVAVVILLLLLIQAFSSQEGEQKTERGACDESSD